MLEKGKKKITEREREKSKVQKIVTGFGDFKNDLLDSLPEIFDSIFICLL